MTPDEAQRYIWSIDFDWMYRLMTQPLEMWPVQRRFKAVTPILSHEDATRSIERYRRFLWLHVKYPGEQLSPPVDVDEAWHYHILNTEAYERDCMALYGRILRHKQSLDPQEQAELEAPSERLHWLFAVEFREHLDTTGLGRWV